MVKKGTESVGVARQYCGEVLADAGYGSCGEFRQGLSERELRWTAGILPQQQAYPDDVTLSVATPPGARGRPRKHPTASARSVSASRMIERLGPAAWRTLTWREGTKGPLRARFAIVRVRVADGAQTSRGRRSPGESVWLICEERDGGERKCHLSNHPVSTPRRRLAASVKSHWSCEQAHLQMKQELGLDHYEGRSWHGLHLHCLLTMIAYASLQHLRLAGKKTSPGQAAAPPRAAGDPAPVEAGVLGEDPMSMLSVSRENHPAESEALNVAK